MPCCKRDKAEKSPLDKILESFALSHETMLDVSRKLDAAMTRGLKGNEDYDVRMFPTYISAVPSSKERGRFLSLDLGVKSLIISLVELRGKHISFRRSTARGSEEVNRVKDQLMRSFSSGPVASVTNALRFRTTKNRDVSTAPLTHLFAYTALWDKTRSF